MVTDTQVRRLFKLSKAIDKLSLSSAKSGMSDNTARKYLREGKLPSQIKVEHTWNTREDPFKDVWEEVKEMLRLNTGLEATTIFKYLQRGNPGKYSDGQLRTLQRRIKHWRALEGPGKEVYFAQEHHPGEYCQSDFTYMSSLGIRINSEPFAHLLYHFVLPYSNWETGMICFSENFESLSEGLQNALWKLGGIPEYHRTDQLSAAIQKIKEPEEFTARYRGLLKHYGLKGKYIQPGKANENGDVEQSHHRFKRALDQSLMLHGSRDFVDRKEYECFLEKLFEEQNAGRRERFAEEVKVLSRLPSKRLEACKRMKVRVGPGSTINVQNNIYSVHSRLINERIEVRIFAEYLEIWYAQRMTERLPRLRGEGKKNVDYRHIIEWLVRKPGAFANYRHKETMFPNSRFRIAYDAVKKRLNGRGDKEYLKILHLAAMETEEGVDNALKYLIDEGKPVCFKSVEDILRSGQKTPVVTDVKVSKIDLTTYDNLLSGGVKAS